MCKGLDEAAWQTILIIVSHPFHQTIFWRIFFYLLSANFNWHHHGNIQKQAPVIPGVTSIE
jgi:hypothetical protein